MLKNRKGFAEVMVVVWVAGIVVSGLVAWLAGPAIIKSVGNLANGGDKNQQKIVHKVDSTRTLWQVDPQHPDKLIPVKETYSEYSNELQAQEVPETLWEKFWKLGIMAIVIIVVLSYLGITPLIALWWNKKIKPKITQAQTALENIQTEQEELTADAKKIVMSIDEGLATMDANIKAAQTMADATTDVNVKQAYTTIVLALQDMKADFMAAMSKRQDSTTKLLVRELKND
jgi:hypothetical protein